MRNSGKRFITDNDLIRSDQFTQMCRGDRANVFIRNRKMPVSDLIFSMINRKGLTLKMELRGYMNISHPGTQISKPGYLKQRMKLNPDAIKYLYQFHNRNFYTDPEAELYTFNGYLVLAADGSNINIPTTPETLEVFGSSSRKGTTKQAALGLACLYDALNRMIIDSTINRVKFNEMAVAEEQLANVRETIGAHPFLVTLDRGYPSIPAFLRLIDSETKFVARLKKSDFKQEQRSMLSDDEDVEVAITDARRRKHIGTYNEAVLMSRESFSIRLVKIWLDRDAGVYEILATNLPRESFPADSIEELYRLRWRIETAYETLKDRLQLENFTGTKPALLAQDIYSTIYVSNVAEDIARDIEQEQEDHLKNDYKHRMAINRSLCIGLLKSDLIYILLEENPDIKEALMQRLYDEISENIVPVRPDRHYERNTNMRHAKYSNTHKRSF